MAGRPGFPKLRSRPVNLLNHLYKLFASGWSPCLDRRKKPLWVT